MRIQAVVRGLTVAIALLSIIVVVGSTVGTGLLSVPLAAPAVPSIGATGKLPNPAGPTAAIADGIERGLPSYLGAIDPSLRSLAERAPASVWSSAWESILWAHAHPDHPTMPQAPLTPFGNSGVLTVASLAVIAAAICFVAGIETIGLACLVAIVAVGLVALYYFFVGSDNTGQLASAARALGDRILLDGSYEMNLQANATVNVLSALNLSTNAFGYEAAAGALSQLGNSTFNSGLDLVQSGVADQLAAELWADASTTTDIYAQLVNVFDSSLGANDLSGFTCPLVDNGPFINSGLASGLQAPGGGTAVCPQASPASFSYPFGFVTPSTGVYTTVPLSGSPLVCGGPPVFLDPSRPMTVAITSGSPTNLTFTLVPITPGPWFNKSAGATHQIVNFTMPSAPKGGYRICDATTSALLYATYAFPLSAVAEAGVDGAPFKTVFISAGGTNAEYANGTEIVSSMCPFVTRPSGSFDKGADLYGGNPTCNAGTSPDSSVHFGKYLWAIASTAAVTGQTYWTFLRNLGYTSISQVPANCIIPSPSQLLPPTIPPSQLETLNVTQLLEIYYATLYGLGKTFNSTTTLSSSNFCGKHVQWNLGANGAVAFGTYAYGWIYVPNATHTSTGTGTENFGQPSTWNLSGLIYLAPAVKPETVQLNVTWLLPEANPTIAFIQPFTNGTPGKNGSRVIANGPSTCLSKGVNWQGVSGPVGACNVTAASLQVTGFLAGNSTQANGSIYPTSIDLTFGKGYAVYLTFCAVATPSSGSVNPTYKPATPCVFQHNTIQVVVTSIGCNATIGAGCGSTGTILPAPFTACGQTAPIWGQFVAAWATLTGTSALGCLAAEALAIISLVVIAAVAVSLAVGASRLFGGRR